MIRICVLIIFSLIIISCSGYMTDTGGRTTVSGTVIDSSNGLPLAGIQVYLDDTIYYQPDSIMMAYDPWTETDSTGYYKLSFEGYGAVLIIVRGDGYNSKSHEVRPTGINQIFEHIDFAL